MAVPAYRLSPGRVPRWEDASYAVPAAYLRALARAGGRGVALAPLDPARLGPDGVGPADDGPAGEGGAGGTDPAGVLQPFDGLLLIGGGDVDPARYGAVRHAAVGGVDPERDGFELGLARAALSMSLPLLAICRGVQVLNVATGGTLHQHLGDLPGMGVHAVEMEGEAAACHPIHADPASLLGAICGSEIRTCTSAHHQALDRLGQGLVAVAWASDGLVEGVERAPGAGTGWLVGVQWHPERTADQDPVQQALFSALSRAALSHAAGAGALGARALGAGR